MATEVVECSLGCKHGEDEVVDAKPCAAVDYACLVSTTTLDGACLLNAGCGHASCCSSCCIA